MRITDLLKLVSSTKKDQKSKKEILNYYQKKAPLSALDSPDYLQPVLLDMLIIAKNIYRKGKFAKVLDFGCGIGNNFPNLLVISKTVTAVDISPKAIACAKKRFELKTNLEFILLKPNQNIPADAAAFDLVVCTEVLEHVPDINQTLKEFFRILKPGGFLLVSTPNYQNLRGLSKLIIDSFTREGFWDPAHAHPGGYERFVTPSLIENHLKNNYFQIIQTRGVQFNTAWSIPNLDLCPTFLKPTLTYSLGKIPLLKRFGMNYFILSRKV